MLMDMLILISMYMRTCSPALQYMQAPIPAEVLHAAELDQMHSN